LERFLTSDLIDCDCMLVKEMNDSISTTNK
jgi:hypothetical protein